MKDKTPGIKADKTRKFRSETLPHRCAHTTITGGDLGRRMANFYGKKAEAGAATAPDATIMITRITRA